MKGMTKLMVVAIALFVVSALLVAPAAARAPAINDIEFGDTIFVYEEGIDFTTNMGAVTRLRKYVDDEPTKALDHEIPVANAANFNLRNADVSGKYGVYYVYAGADRLGDISIRMPSLTADVVLQNDKSSSIDGDSISRNTVIAFKVNAPWVGAYYVNNAGTTYAQVKVEVTTPAGGKTTTFGTVPMRNIDVTSTEFYLENVVLTNEPAGTYTAQVKWDSPSGFADYGAASNTASFTLTTKTLSLTSNVDTIVRNNNFLLTITGESQADYYLYVQSADVNSPKIRPGQPGVTIDDNAAGVLTGKPNFNAEPGTYAKVRTTAAGTRNVEFETSQTTEDKTYTFRVYDAPSTDYDTVKVKVEEGDVTISASGDRTYYIGEEITLSGTNTDSNTVYLFMTGPNLNTAGVNFDGVTVVTGWTWLFEQVDVEADDTWELKVDTQDKMNVDAGTYTIYALTDAFDRNDLSDATYDTISIVLRKGFISSSASASTVAKGDSLLVTGNAQGNPDDVAIWVIGRNHFERYTQTVEDDASFEFELKKADTADLAAGQYFVVVQHPMGDGVFNVGINGDYVGIGTGPFNTSTNAFRFQGTNRLQGSDAAQALIDLLNNQNVDDTYNRLTFLVEEPWVRIDSVSDKYVGTTFTVTGTTNLGVDNELMIEVVSSAFRPTDKTAAGEFSGDSGMVRVVAGDAGYNTWSFEVDAGAFVPDEYIIRAESIDADIVSTTTFNVLEGAPVTEPPVTTPPVTEPPVTTPPATQPPEPPETPGFGALIAIAGLGAVAFLVLRRN